MRKKQEQCALLAGHERGHLARFSSGRDARAPVAQPHPLPITPACAPLPQSEFRNPLSTENFLIIRVYSRPFAVPFPHFGLTPGCARASRAVVRALADDLFHIWSAAAPEGLKFPARRWKLHARRASATRRVTPPIVAVRAFSRKSLAESRTPNGRRPTSGSRGVASGRLAKSMSFESQRPASNSVRAGGGKYPLARFSNWIP